MSQLPLELLLLPGSGLGEGLGEDFKIHIEYKEFIQLYFTVRPTF